MTTSITDIEFDLQISCPFCRAAVASIDKAWVKKWMGEHLAKYHFKDVERALYSQHLKNYKPVVSKQGKIYKFKQGL